VVPVFPLPSLYLFPGTALPLNIFEPRYRQLIEDLLDGTGRLVLATVLPGYENDLAGKPPVHPIAGLGEIFRHERMADGRFVILVVGLQRVRVKEAPSDRLYRKVEIEGLAEVHPPSDVEKQLRPQLLQAVRAQSKMKLRLPRGVPIAQLADLLLCQFKGRIDENLMINLFSELNVTERARRVLAENARLSVSDLSEPGPDETK